MFFFFSSRRRHTRLVRDWSSDVCSSDLSPGSAGGVLDSPLMIGRTFVEQSIGLHVTPMAQSEEGEEVPWIDVVVNVGSFEGNTSPELELMASDTQVDEDDDITFAAYAIDADGDALGAYWDFGDGNYAYNEAEVTHAFQREGEYLVRCEVTDMKGGHTSRYVVVTVDSQIGRASCRERV